MPGSDQLMSHAKKNVYIPKGKMDSEEMFTPKRAMEYVPNVEGFTERRTDITKKRMKTLIRASTRRLLSSGVVRVYEQAGSRSRPIRFVQRTRTAPNWLQDRLEEIVISLGEGFEEFNSWKIHL